MTAWPYFDPNVVEAAPQPKDPLALRDRDVFDKDERIVLAVNVAMSTRRPLLIYGPPGCGKSSLAPNVAGSCIGGTTRRSSPRTQGCARSPYVDFERGPSPAGRSG